MFQAARKHLDEAIKNIKTARALRGFSVTSMLYYLHKAEEQLIMAELYIK